MALERERETFVKELPYLLQESDFLGRYVLVHGDQINSVWPTRAEAQAVGFQRFGMDTFLVQEIAEPLPK